MSTEQQFIALRMTWIPSGGDSHPFGERTEPSG